MKKKLGVNVFEATKERIAYTFDHFEKIIVSFSAGKDSTVMLHMVCDEARKRNRKVAVMLIDLEGQYQKTIEHAEKCREMYKDCTEWYWICLPLHLRNAVSVYEPFWKCWDGDQKDLWIRDMPKDCISDVNYFPFFVDGMEFEEFDVLFAQWYADGDPCAVHIGIRADESLNRYRTIASRTKTTYEGKQWSTHIIDNVYNFYPIYDWKTEDDWIYQGKNPDKPYNELYDYMHLAGLKLSQMRICQPYGDDQRRGLWLFHLIEPETWAKVVARVNGANSGALYINETGDINGYNKIKKPDGHTWKSFAILLINSMPPKTQEHYKNKIYKFCKWWETRGYPDGIPDEADYQMEQKKNVPSWRRVCKSLLRNDYWCKGLSFTQQKSHAYERYCEMMKRKREEEKLNNQNVFDW
jgi:predicted phosphoadenosine phosphosulfate sulfurtransferase